MNQLLIAENKLNNTNEKFNDRLSSDQLPISLDQEAASKIERKKEPFSQNIIILIRE